MASHDLELIFLPLPEACPRLDETAAAPRGHQATAPARPGQSAVVQSMAPPDQLDPLPQPSEPAEERGAVTDALLQTAQDLKTVGLGVAGAVIANKIISPKDPPKE